jgi:hypothetical protein
MLTVWMAGQVTPAQLAQIRAAAPGADVRHFASQSELEARIEEAEVVAGTLSPAALARATGSVAPAYSAPARCPVTVLITHSTSDARIQPSHSS